MFDFKIGHETRQKQKLCPIPAMKPIFVQNTSISITLM